MLYYILFYYTKPPDVCVFIYIYIYIYKEGKRGKTLETIRAALIVYKASIEKKNRVVHRLKISCMYIYIYIYISFLMLIELSSVYLAAS